MISKVGSGDCNAGIVFDAEVYDIFIEGLEHKVFLAPDEDDNDGKLKGLGMYDNKVFKLILKKKSSDGGKLKIKYDGDERKFKVKLSSNVMIVEKEC